jgi:hypothetical protein
MAPADFLLSFHTLLSFSKLHATALSLRSLHIVMIFLSRSNQRALCTFPVKLNRVGCA